MVLPDGAALWQHFVVGILQPGLGKAQSRSSPLWPRQRAPLSLVRAFARCSDVRCTTAFPPRTDIRRPA